MLFRNLILGAAFVTASLASACPDGQHSECLVKNPFNGNCTYAVCVPTVVGGSLDNSINDREWVKLQFSHYGYALTDFDLEHWTAHKINVGVNKWTEDFEKNVVQRRFWDWSLDIADSERDFYYNHLHNVGRDRFEEDVRKAVVRKLFWKCNVDLGPADVDHWYRHSHNVDKGKFLADVKNGRTCSF